MTIILNGDTGINNGAGSLDASAYTGSYTDGIVTDYTTGLGRISVGASDGIAFYRGGIANTESMRIDSSGNVGININIPSTFGKFSVGNTATTGTEYQIVSIAGGAAGGFTSKIKIGAFSGTGTLGCDISSIVDYNSTTGTVLTFGTAPAGVAASTQPSERMRIDSSGNVGIGTSSPVGKLDISTSTGRILFRRGADTGGTGDGTGITAINESATAVVALNIRGNPIPFIIDSTERMRIDSSGNVGVGTSSPSQKLQVNGGIWFGTATLGASMSPAILSYEYPVSRAYIGDGTGYSWAFSKRNSSVTTDLVTITDGGNLLVRASTTYNNAGVYFIGPGGTNEIVAATNLTTTSGYRIHWAFYQQGNYRGEINSSNNTGVLYSTASDYRLKENIAPMQNALGVVAQLKPVTYTWKADGSNGQGFIAHELQEVVPDCVTGEKDAVNEDGSIKPQGIDTSFLVATLTKAIQELNAKVESLEAQLKGN